MSKLLKGGRIEATREDVVRYISSAAADAKIAHAVVRINEAHVIMLAKQRIIAKEHARSILNALIKLEKNLQVSPEFEDVHVQVEEQVSKEAGAETGGNLHLAKSRNDQVATAIRLVLREELIQVSTELLALLDHLVSTAKRHTRTLFPAYTHLQLAQPATYAHFLLGHTQALSRDWERLNETYTRVNRSPMGAGAVAGTSLPIDRTLVAKLLGFEGLIENSLDATGTRDFVLETQGALSVLASNLSRLCQDIIFLTANNVGVLELPDEFASTSSIMPQKKNPDPIEVARARCAKVSGNFSVTSTVLHSLPSGYGMDLQEITPLLWESLDNIKLTLHILGELAPRLSVREEFQKSLEFEFATATELASTLIRNGRVPFREAHRIVGRIVRDFLEKKRPLRTLTIEELQSAAGGGRVVLITQKEIAHATDPMACVEANASVGGPAPSVVQKAVARMIERVKRARSTTENRRRSLARADAALSKAARNG